MLDELTPLQEATRAHLAADMLRAGTYGRQNGGWHACSVGCLAHDLRPNWTADDIAVHGHALVAEHYGYPEWMVRLQDTVFEGLPAGERERWHVDLADAIAARGRDWPIVLHAVHAAILRIAYRTAGQAAPAVQAVLDLHEHAVRGEAADESAWWAAESAESAAAAAAAAAESAAWSAAAAESAAWSAAAESAWWAESAAAAAAAAESAYREIRDAILAEIARSE